MAYKSRFPFIFEGKRSSLTKLALGIDEGLAVEPGALFAYPPLHEADDAEGLVHRFPTQGGSQGRWFGDPLICGLSLEEEFRRGVFVLERTG